MSTPSKATRVFGNQFDKEEILKRSLENLRRQEEKRRQLKPIPLGGATFQRMQRERARKDAQKWMAAMRNKRKH